MIDKQKTPTEAFYRLGFVMTKLVIAMGENANAFWQGAHSMEKFNDQFTYRQRLALWILDTAERLADWIVGESEWTNQ